MLPLAGARRPRKEAGAGAHDHIVLTTAPGQPAPTQGGGAARVIAHGAPEATPVHSRARRGAGASGRFTTCEECGSGRPRACREKRHKQGGYRIDPRWGASDDDLMRQITPNRGAATSETAGEGPCEASILNNRRMSRGTTTDYVGPRSRGVPRAEARELLPPGRTQEGRQQITSVVECRYVPRAEARGLLLDGSRGVP